MVRYDEIKCNELEVQSPENETCLDLSYDIGKMDSFHIILHGYLLFSLIIIWMFIVPVIIKYYYMGVDCTSSL